jgi:hypothetical protein
MTSPRISFTYQSTVASDSWWLRLVQLGIEDDTATLADAADLVNTLYSLDSCTEETTTSGDPDSATTDAVVETEVRRLVCSYDDQANIDVQLHIIRSHPSAPYRLALQGGVLKTVETISETTTQTIVLEDSDTITLDYPVLGEFAASWDGAVYGASGRINPPIIRNGNTISFGGATVKAGTLTATYATEYDLATVTILGVDGEPGQCTARGFFHGLVEELELETPEPADELGTCRVLWTVPSDPHQIECYRTVYVSQRCQCSHDELSGYSYEEVVDCPEYVKRCPGVLNECRHYLGTVVAHEYVECQGDMVEAVSHPAYHKKMCCQEPSVPLPQCEEQITSWRGGLPIKGGAQQYYDLYGKDLEIIPVGPPGGICGTWTKKQQIISNNCCDGVPALAWDVSTSPEVVAPNNTVVIGVTGGGKYPYRWSVVGTGFWFQNGSKGVETDGPQVRLVATSGACGFAQITVTDGCTSSAGAIRCTAGTWENLGSFIPAADFDYEANGFIPQPVNGYDHQETGMGELLGGYYLGNTPYAPGTETWSWATWGAGGQWVCCFDASGMTMSDPIVGVFNNIPITRGSIALGPDSGAPCYPAQWYRPSWLNTSLSVYRWRC